LTIRPSPLATIPFRIIFLAYKYSLALIESYAYKKRGRGGASELSVPPNRFLLFPQRVNSPRTVKPVCHKRLSRGATRFPSCLYFAVPCKPQMVTFKGGTANPGCVLPPVTTCESSATGTAVPLRSHLQSARITLGTALAAARETSPLPPVSKLVRADIGFGRRRRPDPIASRSRQLRDRTRKKAWVHRSNVAF
jgi:hypothetical protein